MMRNRKVWGVLGLLLALVVVVGYGQVLVGSGTLLQPICEVRPATPTRNGPCELFVIDNDVHSTRSIKYQSDQNVAFFFTDGKGTAFSYFNPALPSLQLGVRYCFAITFRAVPPPPGLTPAQLPRINMTAYLRDAGMAPIPGTTHTWTAAVVPQTPTGQTFSFPGGGLNVPPIARIDWEFTPTTNSVEFMSMKVWKEVVGPQPACQP